MENKKNIIQAIDRHLDGMNESDLVLVLRFIHGMKELEG